MEALGETLRSIWVLWLGFLFIGIVIWAMWPSNRAKFESHGRIPLKDDVGAEAFHADKG